MKFGDDDDDIHYIVVCIIKHLRIYLENKFAGATSFNNGTKWVWNSKVYVFIIM
jgi:hypothetical protein